MQEIIIGFILVRWAMRVILTADAASAGGFVVATAANDTSHDWRSPLAAPLHNIDLTVCANCFSLYWIYGSQAQWLSTAHGRSFHRATDRQFESSREKKTDIDALH